MEVVIARQPIFNRTQEVYAYELLYRSTRAHDRAEVQDGDQATSSVIIDALTNIGLETVTTNKPAFINFTENMILNDYATLFPQQSIVIEILEDVTPSDALIRRCTELRNAGYILALDDFVFTERHLALIQQAHIIKMDFMLSDQAQLQNIVRSFSPRGIKFLAEKVETHEDFQKALSWGYEYFQGYFFSKPTLLRSSELAPMRLSMMRLMSASSKSDFEFAEMARGVMQDMGLMVKFLKLLNFVIPSANKGGIATVRQGLVLLGINSFRKWLYLMAMKDFAQDLPDEMTRMALICARFCELYGQLLGFDSDECFMIGLFALGETVMNMSMEDILRDLAISEQAKATLINRQGPLAQVLNLCLIYMEGDFEQVETMIEGEVFSMEAIAGIYIEAMRWCDNLESEMSQIAKA